MSLLRCLLRKLGRTGCRRTLSTKNFIQQLAKICGINSLPDSSEKIFVDQEPYRITHQRNTAEMRCQKQCHESATEKTANRDANRDTLEKKWGLKQRRNLFSKKHFVDMLVRKVP